MDKKQINRIIKIYLTDLSKKITIDKVILFGSAVYGKVDRDSDIDLMIISSKFDRMTAVERFDLLYTSRLNPITQSTAMDIFGMTGKEYAEANSLSLIGEIKETGREITLS